jgi:23S rRNA (guanosine2251-2'-O)-methyltransferase
MPSGFVGGFHAVEVLLKRRPEQVLRLQVSGGRTDKRLDTVIELARGQGINIEKCKPETLDSRVGEIRHQGVVAEVRQRVERNDRELKDFIGRLDKTPFLLVLERVQDPHNLGACLRTAEAAGVNAVILSRAHSAPLSPAVRKVASGAADILDIFRVGNLSRALEVLKSCGVWLVGTSDRAETSLYDVDLNIPLALVMGGEGDGLRKLTSEKCDYLARLPMAGTISSLNVSVATGICLFEAVRQRS